MTMTVEEVAELSRLLDDALSFGPPELGPWLERLHHDRPEMARRLRAMLGRMKSTDRTTLLPELPKHWDEDAVANAGDRVGPYQLVREIGRGGMGSVWLADRMDGTFNRRVALKLPRIAWANGLGRRMAREREISALFEHPQIARLYDAGVDDRGRPFIAMEYVDGRPIDAYCREHALDVRARLKLFVQVVRAVAHAHGQLIVHRDLKPENVLVDATSQVHLLDFGIARLLDESGIGSDVTQEQGRALSLNYASPEQIAGRRLGVTADIYSLGVMLFELLSGSLPYHLKRNTLGAIEDAILAGDAPLASERVKDRTLAKAVRGDVDAIISKAIKLEPRDRYATADAMATDIERYLVGEPVQARPDSAFYRWRKFVRRNRVPVLAAVVTSIALIVGSSLALWQARVASTHVEEAAAFNTFVLSLIKRADPDATPQTKAADVATLAAIEKRIDNEFRARPEQVLGLRLAIGDAYRNRGEAVAAQRVYQQAAAQAAVSLPPRDLQLLTAQVRAADFRLIVSKDSARRLDVAIDQLRAAGSEGSDVLIDALLIRHELGEYFGVPDFTPPSRRYDLITEALVTATQVFGIGSRQHLRVVKPYSRLIRTFEDPKQANQLIENTLIAADARDVDVVNSAEFRDLKIHGLAYACYSGHAAETLQVLWKMSGEVRAAHGDSSPQIEQLLAAMDNCYLALSDPTGNWIPGAALDVAAQRERPPSTALMQRAEASLIAAVDRYDFDDAAAERFYQSTEENAAAIIDADMRERFLRVARMHRVCVLTRHGDAAGAEAFAVSIKAELDAEFARIGRQTMQQLVFWRCLSTAQRRQGRFEDAKRTAQTSIDRCISDKLPNTTRCQARGFLARAEAEVETGDYAAALQSLKERRKQPAGPGLYPDHPLVEGRALLGLGKISDSIESLRMAYGSWLTSRDPRGAYAAEAEYWLGRAYVAAGDPRGRQMVAESRRTLATSALEAHRRLAGQPVP